MEWGLEKPSAPICTDSPEPELVKVSKSHTPDFKFSRPKRGTSGFKSSMQQAAENARKGGNKPKGRLSPLAVLRGRCPIAPPPPRHLTLRSKKSEIPLQLRDLFELHEELQAGCHRDADLVLPTDACAACNRDGKRHCGYSRWYIPLDGGSSIHRSRNISGIHQSSGDLRKQLNLRCMPSLPGFSFRGDKLTKHLQASKLLLFIALQVPPPAPCLQQTGDHRDPRPSEDEPGCDLTGAECSIARIINASEWILRLGASCSQGEQLPNAICTGMSMKKIVNDPWQVCGIGNP